MKIASYNNGALEYRDAAELEINNINSFCPSVQEKINMLKSELATYDYIGIKIAMGVATKEDYIKEIEYTETLRQEIRVLSKLT